MSTWVKLPGGSRVNLDRLEAVEINKILPGEQLEGRRETGDEAPEVTGDGPVQWCIVLYPGEYRLGPCISAKSAEELADRLFHFGGQVCKDAAVLLRHAMLAEALDVDED